MKYIQVCALFLMSVFYTSCGQNQTNPPKDNIKSETKDSITSEVPNGMEMVWDIKQDRNGNIWLTSEVGIIRYDGKSFTNIISKVSSGPFFSVLEDRKGNFWFTSSGSGVYYYDGKSLPTGQAGFQHFTTKEGLVSNSVFETYEDKAGNTWFGTNGGASRYDGKSFRNFTTKEGLSNNEIFSIIEDKTGKFWFGTRGSTSLYDGKTFAVFRDKDGNAFNRVLSIIEDKAGNIWLSAGDGLWRYDGSMSVNSGNSGLFVYEDKKGNIWNGPRKVCSPPLTEIAQSLNLFRIFEAHDGSIWFGASDGVHRYDGKTVKRL